MGHRMRRREPQQQLHHVEGNGQLLEQPAEQIFAGKDLYALRGGRPGASQPSRHAILRLGLFYESIQIGIFPDEFPMIGNCWTLSETIKRYDLFDRMAQHRDETDKSY